jgi:hypothetical protein
MSPISTSVIIASAGLPTMSSNCTITTFVKWPGFISPLRWSRILAAIQSPGDADFPQSIAILSEGSQRDLSKPANTPLFANLQATGSGAPVVSRIQVMASQNDTF